MLVASWFFRVKHFPQRSRFPEVERDGCDNMISRKGRHAPQRYSRMLFFAALRGLGEPIFSLAKGAMRRKENHPVLGEIALPQARFPPASGYNTLTAYCGIMASSVISVKPSTFACAMMILSNGSFDLGLLYQKSSGPLGCFVVELSTVCV